MSTNTIQLYLKGLYEYDNVYGFVYVNVTREMNGTADVGKFGISTV